MDEKLEKILIIFWPVVFPFFILLIIYLTVGALLLKIHNRFFEWSTNI